MEIQKEVDMKHKIEPEFRYRLKGEIHAAGFKTTSDFSKEIGVDLSLISRIINGWTIPSPKTARKMATAMNVTLREFKNFF